MHFDKKAVFLIKPFFFNLSTSTKWSLLLANYVGIILIPKYPLEN